MFLDFGSSNAVLQCVLTYEHQLCLYLSAETRVGWVGQTPQSRVWWGPLGRAGAAQLEAGLSNGQGQQGWGRRSWKELTGLGWAWKGEVRRRRRAGGIPLPSPSRCRRHGRGGGGHGGGGLTGLSDLGVGVAGWPDGACLD